MAAAMAAMALGFWLAGVLGIAAGGTILSWVIAVAGAGILIALLKATNVLG